MPSDSPPTSQTKKPVRLGKYEIVHHIATGGMGAVYRARDAETGTDVALKILPPDKAANPAMVVRFRREYAAASKMRHENIVQLLELEEVNGTLYFAMEFVDGVDLYEHLTKSGPFDPETSRQIALQAARALRHANQHGVVHRDIKPSNFLMLRRPGKPVVKLTDFGLAREVDDDQFRVTRAGTTVGTLDYMSPEQARDSGTADIRSDLYSLGSTWFHLLTGRSPFPEGGLGERLIKLMNDAPPDVRDKNPKVSDELAAVIERLLEKDPDDRYQTPEELIDDLVSLEGKTVAREKPVKKKPKKRPAVVAPSALADEEEDAKPEANSLPMMLGAGAAVLVVAVVLILALPRRRPADDPGASAPPPVVPPVVVPFDPGKDAGTTVAAVPPKDGDKTPSAKPTLPVLYRLPGGPAGLRAEVETPWAGDAPAAVAALKVRRVASEPGTFRSLAEAAASVEGPVVIEIHDNGPLFELPLIAADRPVTVRAGPGYRPLIVWDVPATVEKRRQDRKPEQPLVFLAGKGLTLSGVEVCWRCPETLAEPVTLLASGGDVRLSGCTFSMAGKPREAGTLLQVRRDADGAKVRLDRCHVRGTALVALDVTAGGAEVLIDGCLMATATTPLLKVRGKERPVTNLRLVRSTLLGPKLIDAGGARTGLSVLAWDSILARAGDGPGEMLTHDAAEAVEWRAVNAVYAGWGRLLGGGKAIADLAGWRTQWGRGDGDGAAREAWPDGLDEPAARPAAALAPGEGLRFASTVDAEKPLGCDLAALPACRDGWAGLALEPTFAPPEALADADAPPIPDPGDERFHGARLDLNDGTDVGAYLASVQATKKLGERVVMHLAGKGEKPTSPIRVRGATLVLHFEEPADKDAARLALKGAVGSGGAVIEVERGGLDVINGVIRAPDTPKSAFAQVIRVSGGPMRLFRTRVEGPTLSVPDAFTSAVTFVGSGSADAPAACSLSECVLVSSQKGLTIEGIGARVLVHQSLVVAAEGLGIAPGFGCKHNPGVQVTLDRATVAFRRCAVALGPVADEGLLTPAAVRSRDCAFLCPFAAKPGRAGLIGYESESLLRGLLAWHSERDAHDARVHYAAWPAGSAPEARDARAWGRLVGTYGARDARPELVGLKVIDGKSWALERLALPGREPPGANLGRLGVGVKK